jgi:hypothetical protein
MRGGIALATTSSAPAEHLSDPRVVGVIATLVGSMLLANGLCALSLGGGWRVVAISVTFVGAVTVVIGAVGFTLNRWIALSAALAVFSVAGMFGALPLMVPSIRAQSLRRGLSLTLGSFAVPWAVAAIVVVTASGPSTRGFEAAVIPGVTIYLFVWGILKGLLKVSGDLYDANPAAASPTAAMAVTLRGGAMIAGVVAAAMASADLLLRVFGASTDTREIVGFSLVPGFFAVGFLIMLGYSADPAAGFLVAKAAVLLVIPAFMAPDGVLAAGVVCITAGLIARIIPTSLPTVVQEPPPVAPD